MSLFAKPHMLWLLLLLVTPLCVFMFWTWRTKQKLIAQFVQSRLLANLTVGVSQARQKLRLVLLVAAVFFLVLAMARPQWGFSWEEAKQQGLDIVVAIDTSRSMLAEDLAPNRLTRAKLAALDLMRLAKNDRLGLVAFAGSAFLQCPLTLDEEAFRQSLEALDVGIIPQGGTAMTEAIQSALTAFEKGNDNHKVLVLFTDGEDHDSNALAAAEKAAKEGLKIFTIGVGTAEGELIRVRDEQGTVGFLKDDSGNAVKSRLDETLLQKIATAANGFYLPLRGAKPMDALYAQGLAPLPKSDSTTKLVRQYRERFHWPLGIAILLLVLEMFLPQRKRIARPSSNGVSSNKTDLAATAILLLMLGTFSANASPSSALKEYESGNFHTALDEFKKLSQQKTNDLRLSYNAGAAAYRAKQFEDAEKFFSQATTSPDLKLQQQSYYNLGNTLFEAGEQIEEADKKQKAWESSLQNFENSLKLDPQDTDAKNNLDLVKKKLEELKKQQQQQQSKNDQSKDKENQDKTEEQKDQDQKQDQNKDSQSQQKDSEKKDDPSEQQQDSTKQENEEQQKDSEQAKKDQEQQKNQQKQNGEEQKQGEKEGEEQEAMAMAAGQMTPEQARQFLDAQRQEDKALIFAPQKDPKQINRKLKDW